MLPRSVLTATALVAMLGAVLVAGCLPPPVGPTPLRYRDVVFDGVTKTADVTYAKVTSRQGQPVTLLADVYRPTGDTVKQRPAIVWVHGGGFLQGVLSRTSSELVDQATVFAKKGFVNVSIEYRLSPTGCLLAGAAGECALAIHDALTDAQTAVRWLRAHASKYGVDRNRIAIGGSSAGAITALNVGFNGDTPTTGPYRASSSRVQASLALSGTAIPTNAIGPGDAPALLFHGTVDPLVSYSSAKATYDAARAAGIAAYLVTWTDAGHVPYAPHRSEILDTTTNFLYRALRLTDAAR